MCTVVDRWANVHVCSEQDGSRSRTGCAVLFPESPTLTFVVGRARVATIVSLSLRSPRVTARMSEKKTTAVAPLL